MAKDHASELPMATFEMELVAAPKLPGGVGPDPYRWPALLVYGSLSCIQGATWATFSAVPLDVTTGFFAPQALSKFTVDLLLNWGMIVFVPTLPLAMWLHAQRGHGLLLALKVAAALVALGALVRCCPYVWCAHLAQASIGIAGPFVWNACASFSSAWFPPEERTFATAIGGGASFLGPGLQFLAMLPITTKEGFARVLWLEAGLCCLIGIAVLAALPAKPRHAPSASAHLHEGSGDKQGDLEPLKGFREDLVAVGSNRDCWLIGLGSGVSSGLYTVYASSLPVVLHRDEGDSLSKWLGFVSIMAFVFGSLAISLLSDRCFTRNLKALLLILLIACLVGVAAFAVELPSPLYRHGFSHSEVARFASMTLLSLAMGGTFPVSIELAAEIAYPAEESTVVGAITSINNISGMVYLMFMDRIPNSDVNVPLLLAVVAAFLLMACVRENYARRDADEGALRSHSSSASSSASSQ